MARAPASAYKYAYRAFFKPDSLDVFDGFDRGLDSSGRGLGYTQAWHRANWEHSPYAVVNEFICGELGRFVRLPIPPFAITYRPVGKKREPLFSSLDFNYQRDSLPAVIPELCVEALPELCAGILAFDILIANEDRHDMNLLVDRVAKPRRLYVYDHDQALLGGLKRVGKERLIALRDRLGITGSSVTGGNPHVFLPYITQCVHLYDWAKRFHSIPDWFIQGVCTEARGYGLSVKLAKETVDFLIHRRENILSIIDSNRSAFAITDWPRERQWW